VSRIGPEACRARDEGLFSPQRLVEGDEGIYHDVASS
jgi:hypothetical protein